MVGPLATFIQLYHDDKKLDFDGGDGYMRLVLDQQA